MAPGTCDVALLTATDDLVDPLHHFYVRHPSEGLVPRSRDDVARQIAARATVVGWYGGEIIAVASNFEPVFPYVEVGGTLIAEPFRGYGLQKLFFAARFASLLLNQGPNIVIVTSIKPWNRDSLGSALRVGFELWATPAVELFGSCATCPKRREQSADQCCATYYKIAPDRVRRAVGHLLALTEHDPRIELRHREHPDRSLGASLWLSALYGSKRAALKQMVADAAGPLHDQ